MARVVVSQEAGGRDGHLAALEFTAKVVIDMAAARLSALPLADTGVRLGQQSTVDVDSIAITRIDVGAAPDHDPIKPG